MRLLVAMISGFGHIRPSAPIAAAARRRGHEVRHVVSARDRLMSGMLEEVASGEIAWFRHEVGLPPDLDPERRQDELTIVGAEILPHEPSVRGPQCGHLAPIDLKAPTLVSQAPAPHPVSPQVEPCW